MKPKNYLQKVVAILFLFLICQRGLAGELDHKQFVAKEIAKLMRQYQIPGAAVAIIDGGKPYTYVFGIASETNNTPVTNNTIFEVGSITKLFTALLCVAAQNQPGNPLIKYYPIFSNNPYLQKITLEELLTYTSKLPFELPTNIKTMSQMQSYLLKWRPTNVLDLQWQYSNVGIGLLGIALQNKDHKKIDQLYRKYILEQLDMKHTGIEINKKFWPYFAQGHKEDGNITPYSFDSHSFYSSAGGMKSNIQDMSRFLTIAAGLQNTPLNLKQAMENTQTPRLEVNGSQQGLVWQIHSLIDHALLNEPEKMNLGPLPAKWLPKNQQVFDPNKLIDKTGATNGFRAYIAVIPGKQRGIVILLNKYIPNGAIVNTGRRIVLWN